MDAKQNIDTGESYSRDHRLDPFELLSEYADKRRDGCLSVSSQGIRWRIYLAGGCLKYASIAIDLTEDFDYQLRCLNESAAADALKANSPLSASSPPFYPEGNAIARSLHWLVEHSHFSSDRARQLAEKFSRDALETYFWLSEGEVNWTNARAGVRSDPAIEIPDPVAIDALIAEFRQRRQQWQQFAPKIKSPYQRPYLFARARTDTAARTPTLQKLSKCLRGLSIQQLSGLFKQDILQVVRLLYPFIQSGEIFLREAQAPFHKLPEIPPPSPTSASPKTAIAPITRCIACIDDSPAIVDTVKQYLGAEGYAVTGISNSVEAPGILFRLKPDLVLLDISMPEIDGYKLCSLLRDSSTLRQTPIVMVTGRTSSLDRVRAKIVGATDYLTKPFAKSDLLAVVGKYLAELR